MSEFNEQVDFILSANKHKKFLNDKKGDADLEKQLEILEKERDTLKTIIDLKDLEIKEIKKDNKILTKEIEDLKKEAQDTLLYP
tara:strand:- start:729 stop:980 length:252 start_codon:yes stop_codon:yes gene_type:complete